MPTRVRFVLNKLTGEVEEFIIDDQDRSLPEDEHDRIAREVGALIARNPTLSIAPRTAPVSRPAPASSTATSQDEDERQPETPTTQTDG